MCGPFLIGFDNAKVIVETLFGDALTPAIALDFLNVVLVLLTVSKAFIALNLIFVVIKLLLLVMLLDRFLLEPSALLQFQLLVDPVPRELVEILV